MSRDLIIFSVLISSVFCFDLNYYYDGLEAFEPLAKGYNPDVDLDTAQLISKYGYPVETHTVTTPEGYILGMHRIPCVRSSCINRTLQQPVFLQHGILCSSADWVVSGPQKGFAYILADAGYDVWMGNARGNTYSKRHTKMKNTDDAFWDYSWHDMAIQDIPVLIDHIYKIRGIELNHTEPRNDLLYIGHSMGTTMFFVMTSLMPEYNAKVRAMFALSPVGYMKYIGSPITYFAPFSGSFQTMSLLFGHGELAPAGKVTNFLSTKVCTTVVIDKAICANFVFLLCGFDKEQYNATLMEVVLTHSPAGISTKTFVHYLQEMHNDGEFQYFDYGKLGNIQKYGQKTPPKYPLENVNVPLHFYYADNDWMAMPKDVMRLADELVDTKVEMYRIPFDKWNHADMLWGIDAPELVYKKVIKDMRKYEFEVTDKNSMDKKNWIDF